MSHPNRFYVEADCFKYDPPLERSLTTQEEAEVWMTEILKNHPKATFKVIYGRLVDVKPVEVTVRIELQV